MFTMQYTSRLNNICRDFDFMICFINFLGVHAYIAIIVSYYVMAILKDIQLLS